MRSFLSALALIAATVEKIATEIRHLQRSEVGEAFEPFGRKQKGSSAMPHKRNPILCERMCGMARLLRGYAMTGLENVALWHERDISHSSAERVIFPDACIALDYMLHLLIRVLDGLDVQARAHAAEFQRQPRLAGLGTGAAGADRNRLDAGKGVRPRAEGRTGGDGGGWLLSSMNC